MHPLIEQLAAELAAVVPAETVAVSGAWSTKRRLLRYQSAQQLGSGVGPYVEVVDFRWGGILACPVPLVGYLILITPNWVSWVKSAPPVTNPTVGVSLSAHAEYRADRASFAASLPDCGTSSVVFTYDGDLIASCTLGPSTAVTGRVHLVAEVEGGRVATILLPKSVVTVGRNRLWRLRDEVAASLSEDVRRHLVWGRTGTLSMASG